MECLAIEGENYNNDIHDPFRAFDVRGYGGSSADMLSLPFLGKKIGLGREVKIETGSAVHLQLDGSGVVGGLDASLNPREEYLWLRGERGTMKGIVHINCGY